MYKFLWEESLEDGLNDGRKREIANIVHLWANNGFLLPFGVRVSEWVCGQNTNDGYFCCCRSMLFKCNVIAVCLLLFRLPENATQSHCFLSTIHKYFAHCPTNVYARSQIIFHTHTIDTKNYSKKKNLVQGARSFFQIEAIYANLFRHSHAKHWFFLIRKLRLPEFFSTFQ